MFLQYLFDPFDQVTECMFSKSCVFQQQFCDNSSVSCNLRPKFRSGLKRGEECPATCFGEVVFVLSLSGPGAGRGWIIKWPTKMEK